jgi:hypothetical protein
MIDYNKQIQEAETALARAHIQKHGIRIPELLFRLDRLDYTYNVRYLVILHLEKSDIDSYVAYLIAAELNQRIEISRARCVRFEVSQESLDIVEYNQDFQKSETVDGL